MSWAQPSSRSTQARVVALRLWSSAPRTTAHENEAALLTRAGGRVGARVMDAPVELTARDVRVGCMRLA